MGSSRARKALFALVPLVALLGLAEGIQRISDHRKTNRQVWDHPTLHTTRGLALAPGRSGVAWELDPQLLYRNRPNQRSERGTINAQGFRGPDWKRDKPPGTKRVFLLGGSVAYGWGVAGDENTISARMQSALGPGFEVLNAGVIGYSSTQELILLETVLLDWQPDAIVVLDGWNDLLYASRTPLDQPIRPLTFGELETILERGQDGPVALLRLSALWRAVERRSREAAGASAAAQPFVDHPDGPRVYRRNLELIARIARAWGLEAVLAIQPELSLRKAATRPELAHLVDSTTGRGWLEYARGIYPRYREAARDVAAANGARFVDGNAALDAVVEECFVDSCHLTSTGNEALARALAEALQGSSR